MGSEINQLIGKINTEETKNITIPVTAIIDGTFTSPNVKTDLTSGITNLTKQLIEIEKQKLLNQGKDKAKNMLEDLIGNNKTKTDSIKKEQNNTVNSVLKDIIGSQNTKTDSTKNNTTKNVVKNVLGSLLNKKEKGKDTLN